MLLLSRHNEKLLLVAALVMFLGRACLEDTSEYRSVLCTLVPAKVVCCVGSPTTLQLLADFALGNGGHIMEEQQPQAPKQIVSSAHLFTWSSRTCVYGRSPARYTCELCTTMMKVDLL